MTRVFWFTDRQWALLEPCLPQHQPGAHRVDDRRIVSGIVHVFSSGCAWTDCPAEYGPPTTIYNRWRRWRRRLVWCHILRKLGELEDDAGLSAIIRQIHAPPRRHRGRRGAQAEVTRIDVPEAHARQASPRGSQAGDAALATRSSVRPSGPRPAGLVTGPPHSPRLGDHPPGWSDGYVVRAREHACRPRD